MGQDLDNFATTARAIRKDIQEIPEKDCHLYTLLEMAMKLYLSLPRKLKLR